MPLPSWSLKQAVAAYRIRTKAAHERSIAQISMYDRTSLRQWMQKIFKDDENLP